MTLPITPERIAALLHCPAENVSKHWPLIENAIEAVGIGSVRVKFAVLATVRVECPPFKPVHEYGGEDYLSHMYDGRADLGNTSPGDGALYCGRGFVQITGRNNYQHYGDLLGIGLVAHPEIALEPVTAAAILALYFKEHRIAAAADAEDWRKVRRLVNGGTNGLTDFLRYVAALKAELEQSPADLEGRSR